MRSGARKKNTEKIYFEVNKVRQKKKDENNVFEVKRNKPLKGAGEVKQCFTSAPLSV